MMELIHKPNLHTPHICAQPIPGMAHVSPYNLQAPAVSGIEQTGNVQQS